MPSFRIETRKTLCEYLRHRSFNSWCLQVSGSYSLICLPLTFAGLIMVLAWMVFSSVGMTIARFFKSEWSDKIILGQKVWFQVLHLHYRSSIINKMLRHVHYVLIHWLYCPRFTELAWCWCWHWQWFLFSSLFCLRRDTEM